MSSEDRLIQVIPADGWRVALVECDLDEAPRLFEEPLVGWGLVGGSDDRNLEGLVLVPGLEHVVPCYRVFVETNEAGRPTKFLGYLKPGEDLAKYREKAEHSYADWRRIEEKDMALWEAGWTEHKASSWPRRWESPDGRLMNKRQALKELRDSAA